MAEGGGLLNRYTALKPYRGFESLRLRQPRLRPLHIRQPLRVLGPLFGASRRPRRRSRGRPVPGSTVGRPDSDVRSPTRGLAVPEHRSGQNFLIAERAYRQTPRPGLSRPESRGASRERRKPRFEVVHVPHGVSRPPWQLCRESSGQISSQSPKRLRPNTYSAPIQHREHGRIRVVWATQPRIQALRAGSRALLYCLRKAVR